MERAGVEDGAPVGPDDHLPPRLDTSFVFTPVRGEPLGRPPRWAGLLAGNDRPLTAADVRAGCTDRPPPRAARQVVRGSRAAAVLLLVFDRDSEAHLVLIERGHDAGTHRGDVAFPGGVAEAGEPMRAAALREAHEEVGLHPDLVEVIAELDTRPTYSGFVIHPFVAVTAEPPELVAAAAEVRRAFAVPLSAFLAEGAYWQEDWSSEAAAVIDFFEVPDGLVWGLTGSLVAELLVLALEGRRRRG